MCTLGTVCNPETGYCEDRACGGKCGEHETCEITIDGEECVPSQYSSAYRGPGPAPQENARSPLESTLELCE